MDQACAAVQLSWVLRKALALLSTLEVRPPGCWPGQARRQVSPQAGLLLTGPVFAVNRTRVHR